MGRLKIYRLVLLAFLLALSVLLHYLESFIPVPVVGFRFGLANIPLLFALYYYGYLYYLGLLVLKLFFVAILFTGFGPSFFMALGGSLLAAIIGFICYKLVKNSIYATSICQSIGHAIGQIAAYMLFFMTPSIALYLVILAPISMVTGFLVALFVKVIITRLPRSFKESEKKRRL